MVISSENHGDHGKTKTVDRKESAELKDGIMINLIPNSNTNNNNNAATNSCFDEQSCMVIHANKGSLKI